MITTMQGERSSVVFDYSKKQIAVGDTVKGETRFYTLNPTQFFEAVDKITRLFCDTTPVSVFYDILREYITDMSHLRKLLNALKWSSKFMDDLSSEERRIFASLFSARDYLNDARILENYLRNVGVMK